MIDALCCNASTRATSVVELQLNNCFERGYSSIFRSIGEFHKPRSMSKEQSETEKTLTKVKQKLQTELIKHLPEQTVYPFAIDTTPTPRCYAKTLTDRHYVHQSTPVPGQKPITVGHTYSAVCYLAEAHWAVPLSIERVASKDNKILKGVQQLTSIAGHEHFKNALLAAGADSAYCCAAAICEAHSQDNIVLICRMKNNRVVYKRWEGAKKKGKGRPKKYGDKCHLSEELGTADSSVILNEITKKGKSIQIHIDSWADHLLRGERDYPLDDKPVRIIKVSVCDKKGHPIYRRPLWLCVSGKQAHTLSLEAIYRYYSQRFDIEYFFKLGKTRLLMNTFQTPETGNEENWMQFVMVATHMLYHAKPLAEQVYRPWERPKAKRVNTTAKTPFQVFRAMPEIISQVGTPACLPKKRGIPAGRKESTTMEKRPIQPIVRKSKLKNDQLSIKLGVREKQRVLNLSINSDSTHDEPKPTISRETLLQKIQTKVEGLGIEMA